MTTPRTVIVTGGSRGLGEGIVQHFLDAGDRVATCARSETDAVRAWQSDPAYADRFLFRKADMADRDQCTQFFKDVVAEWKSVDILVNNAGVARDGILALFSENNATPPAGLTDFDRAYLQALYEGHANVKGISKLLRVAHKLETLKPEDE